jgi:hypothetical protein
LWWERARAKVEHFEQKFKSFGIYVVAVCTKKILSCRERKKQLGNCKFFFFFFFLSFSNFEIKKTKKSK